jgi:hypothetical protein
MTTICFDGKELVADSRVTTVDLDDDNRAIFGKVTGKRDTLVKIVEPKNFTLNGEQVLAIGVAGDARIPAAFVNLDDLDEYQGFPIVKEIHCKEFFTQWADLYCRVDMIVISKSFWAVGWMNATDDRKTVLFHMDLFKRDDAKQWAMIGSGFQATQLNMQNDGIPAEAWQARSARECVQMGIVCDPMSGGPLRVWSDETGLQVVEVDAEVEAMKEILEENNYAADTMVDLAQADKRAKEIKAERAQKLAA